MGIRNVLETLRDGIANDVTLKAYCQSTYTKDQTVYLGIDKRNPPGEDKTPVIIIAYVERTEKMSNRIKYRILVGYSVSDETITTLSNKVTYNGFVYAEELREQTETAILKLRKNLGKIDLEGDVVDNTIFPQFAAGSFITIENINSSRS